VNSGTKHLDEVIYSEIVSSKKTELLFLVLTFGFMLLSISRLIVGRLDALTIVWIAFFLIFCFYSINYRTLIIRLTKSYLKLRFGIFSWTISIDNIESISIDVLPPIMKYGGAGIHFMTIRNRYRASFNFLEYPRVVIRLKRKQGLVKDISFSTKQPSDILVNIRDVILCNQGSN
jgi:hypothetical protein